MKRLFHTPGLCLIALCGVVCIVLGLDEAEEWLRGQYLELDARCK